MPSSLCFADVRTARLGMERSVILELMSEILGMYMSLRALTNSGAYAGNPASLHPFRISSLSA